MPPKTHTYDEIYKLFYNSELVEIFKSERDYSFITPPSTPVKEGNPMSPETKQFVESLLLSPQSEKIMIKDISNDDEKRIEKELKERQIDIDYVENLEANQLGLYLETHLSFHGVCPVCHQPTLRKYDRKNMPVVDLICVNEKHLDNTCKIFQVKMSLGSDYFNKKNEYVSTGSKNFGQICHEVRGTDVFSKKIVPGYICVRLEAETKDSTEKYRIVKNESFVLIPKYNETSNETYYKYLDDDPKNKMYYKFGGKTITLTKNLITWNTNLVRVEEITSVIDGTRIIRDDTLMEKLIEQTIKEPIKQTIEEQIEHKQKKPKHGGKRYILVK